LQRAVQPYRQALKAEALEQIPPDVDQARYPACLK
jgi:hypothetical protein